MKTIITKDYLLIIDGGASINSGDWFWADEYHGKPEQAKFFEKNLINGFIGKELNKIVDYFVLNKNAKIFTL